MSTDPTADPTADPAARAPAGCVARRTIADVIGALPGPLPPTIDAAGRGGPSAARGDHPTAPPRDATLASAGAVRTSETARQLLGRGTGVSRFSRPSATPDQEALISAPLAETAEHARALAPAAPASGPHPTTGPRAGGPVPGRPVLGAAR